LQKAADGAPLTMIRVEGFENSVAYRTAELQKILSAFGEAKIDTDTDRTAAAWRSIRDVEVFHGRDGDIWRLSVKPSDAPVIVSRLNGAEAVYDWGGGLIWLLVPASSNATEIRSAVAETGGHATLIRGNRAAGAFQPLSPAVAALHDGLRARFDPRGVLNPGLMGRAA
jgi:glycolate oxidase FAD binding subunit